MSKYAVQVKNVRKKFSYSNHKNNSLKRAITQVFKPKDTTKDSFYALDGVSFNVEKGDFFGVLGRNGSGKSTLLKIISGIYQPTSGSAKHDGKIVSFIELGVGFKSELTGKENVYLNGGLLGFSKPEVDAMYDDIVAFAELEDFMDQQLKNYSSGMKVRLAFSVAIRAKADVLILDEVLAVGDAAFQKKCTDYFETLKNDGKTVILVTHSMGNVRRFCNKAVVIDGGKIIYEGGADKAADKYLSLFERSSADGSLYSGAEEVAKARVTHELLRDDKKIQLKMQVMAEEDVEDAVIGVTIRKGLSDWVYRWATDHKGVAEIVDLEEGKKINVDLSIQNIFPDGNFFVNIWIKSRDRSTIYFAEREAYSFQNSRGGTEARYWRPSVNYSVTGK